MGLTQKILLYTGLLVVALVVTTVAFTTVQADRLAHQTIHQALLETRDVWQTFQADRYIMLRLGIRVLGNDPAFKAMVEGTDQATILDAIQERNDELKADFFIVTDPSGLVVARTDRPTAQGEDLSADPLVQKPLEGEEAATVWGQGGRLFHAVSVPMSTGPDLKGVLIAGYGINETLANDIRKLTHSEIAYLTQAPGQPALLAVSSLGPKEAALRSALASVPAASDQPFHLDLGGERHVAVLVPLKAATGETVGSMLALRSLAVEMAAFRKFRTGLLLVSGAGLVVALLLAYLTAKRITGPVRRLVGMVERARDGSYAGKVAVATSDEIGVLARSFNQLVTELREKEHMIGFLREGMTVLRKGSGVTSDGTGTAADPATAETRSVRTVTRTMERGSVFAARYEVLESIGKGGMGVVFRARDRQLDEVVALKVLRDDALSEDASLLERFKTELKLARRITHKNVLRTHDFGEADGTAYISMEYLEGVTLKDLVRSKGALPLAVGLRIAKHMCHGLEAAHAQGVVHRDVKPQNMLILPETGELKIMDFGIARVSEVEGGISGLTTDGSVLGTPDYMPPEQATGGQADFRSDIYSLGVVFFEIFTGRLPFTGEKLVQVILGHVQKPPPSPRSYNPSLPDDLEAVILRCLEKKPAARYQKVADVLRDLSAVSSRLDSAA
jgi:HAMP domain-containing protein/predicted Ser/Thr protein kinase